MKVRLKITILVNPSDLTWHFPILVTIRELPFKKFPRKITREVEGKRGHNWGSQEEEEDSEK